MIKRKFKVALASAGITQADWAKEHNISAPCLSKLLSGKMTSKKMFNEVNRFISAQFKMLRLSAGSRAA